jgi:adenylate cyclase
VVLEGSVRRSGNRLRVTAQLVSPADGYQLWSERYDRELTDVFAIQDDIVEAILKEVAPALAGRAREAVIRPTDNLEAYELYLKGRHYWHQRSPSTLQMAVQSLEQVIALDPQYALAHAGLADCYSIYRAYGWFSAGQTEPRAREAVRRAMALGPSLADVHFSQALYTIYFVDLGWRQAVVHLKKAIQINPRLAAAHAYLGIVHALDRHDEDAVREAVRATELEPVSPYIHFVAAYVFVSLGRFPEAERESRKALELQPDYLAGLWALSSALNGLGRTTEAVAMAERVVATSRASTFVGLLGLSYARAGRTDEARRLLVELEERAIRGEYVSPIGALDIWVGLGDVAGVCTALRQCLDDKMPLTAVASNCGPWLDQFRGDKEVRLLLDRLYGRPQTGS